MEHVVIHDVQGPATPVRRPYVVLAVLCSSQLLLSIDVTIVAVANPSIETALGFTGASLQWTLTAYALTFGGFLLLGGRMADLYGRRRLFVIGTAGFTLTSLAAGLAQTPVQLIAGRAGQGLFAAIISPCTLSILASTFAEGKGRERAYGIWAGTGSLGGMIGFLLGGLLTSAFGWRSIFLINGPIGLLSVVCALIWLPGDAASRGRKHLDLPGAVTITLGSGLAILGVGQAESHGWTSPAALVPIVLGVALTGLFVLIEARTAKPLLPFRVLQRRNAIAIVPLTFMAVLANATIYLSALYLQHVREYSASASGAAVLGLPVGFGLGANIGSRLVDRLGVRHQAVLGFAIIAVSLAWLARTPDDGPLIDSFLPGLFGIGLGMGIALIPLITTVTTGVADDDQGVVAGVYGMSQQIGGAVGLAVLAGIAASGAAAVSDAVGSAVAEEAHAIRLALVGSLIVALAGALVAGFTLPRRLAHHGHDGVLPLTGIPEPVALVEAVADTPQHL
jgi:EmrB/QacA subfamily drug resistance transporter